MKLLILGVATIALCSIVWADTKILRNISLEDGGSSRKEQISLNNANTAEEELIIEGTYKQNFFPSNMAAPSPHQLTTIYVADKNGYRAKYTLEVSTLQIGYLNPSTFKSLTG